MTKMLKRDRSLLKKLMSRAYPDKYVSVDKYGKTTIKNKWYSLFGNVKITLEEAATELLPKLFASVNTDPKMAFVEYRETIDFHKNGHECIKYMYDEFTNLSVATTLNIQRVTSNGDSLSKGSGFKVRSKPSISRAKSLFLIKERLLRKSVRSLPVGEASQMFIPFTDIATEDDDREVIAVITTGNPEWDKEIEKVTRPKRTLSFF